MKIDVKAKVWMDPTAVSEAVRGAVVEPLAKCAYLVESKAKKLVSIGGGLAQEPSLPGQPPHLQTGNLRASIATAKVSETRYIVGPTNMAWYARVLEFGGRFIAARPFMRPALYECIMLFPEVFRVVNQYLNTYGRAILSKSRAARGEQ